VIDLRSLMPLDTATVLASLEKTGRLFTVEENPEVLGWGSQIAALAVDEGFWHLDGPVRRITTPHIPLPAADSLEDHVMPSAQSIASIIEKSMQI
jgi:acetoin:2,6-dichlorophenolindophenol oxidoreductase subunit beta